MREEDGQQAHADYLPRGAPEQELAPWPMPISAHHQKIGTGIRASARTCSPGPTPLTGRDR